MAMFVREELHPMLGNKSVLLGATEEELNALYLEPA